MKRIVNVTMSITAFAVLALALAPKAYGSAQGCTNATLKGRYGATITGTIGGLPFAELDLVSSTGNGTFSGTGTIAFNGSISPATFTATYTINADCSGSAVLSTGVTQNLTIKADGSEVMFIGTNDPTAVVTGDAKQLAVEP